MTCIIGLKEDGKVHIGGDKSASDGWIINETGVDKVFRKDDYVIGYTTSFRMGQLLQYVIDLPKPGKKVNVEFMVTKFVPVIRQGFKDHGFSEVANNEETAGQFIVGVKGSLFFIENNYAVIEHEHIAVCGSGEVFALAAMEGLCYTDFTPVAKISNALAITAKYCQTVTGIGNIICVSD